MEAKDRSAGLTAQGDVWASPYFALSLRSGGSSDHPFRSLNLGRSAGDDIERVEENERLWQIARGLPGPPARARLDHGTRSTRVDRPGVYGPFDALLTREFALPLWVTVADCYPVFLVAGDWIALLHCGWKGAAAGAIACTVEELSRASGVEPRRQLASVGPGIGPCCYPVGADVAARFPKQVVVEAPPVLRLDLGLAIHRGLWAAGLREERTDRSQLCTACRSDLFFSYRRDGARSGRMAAVIWR